MSLPGIKFYLNVNKKQNLVIVKIRDKFFFSIPDNVFRENLFHWRYCYFFINLYIMVEFEMLYKFFEYIVGVIFLKNALNSFMIYSGNVPLKMIEESVNRRLLISRELWKWEKVKIYHMKEETWEIM